MSLVFQDLGELVNFKGGGTPSRNVEEYWNSSIPWATVKDLNEGITLTETQEFISELGLKNSASNLIAKGTIIIPTRMALGKVVISEIDVAINQDLKAVLVKDKEKLDVKYLLRFLESNKENIASMGKGATVKGITLDQLKAIKIPLPPLSEQRRIASILDQADELRQKRQQAIEKLNEYITSSFYEKFLKNNNYVMKKLSECCTKITDGAHHTPTYTDKGIPFLRVTDITTELNWNKVKYIPQKEHEDLIKRCKPEKGDVLYSKNGTIGVPKLVTWDKDFSIFVSLALLKVKKETLRSEFLESFLLTPRALEQARKHSKTGTVTNLHLIEIREMQIPVPSLIEQDMWISQRNFLENIKATLQQSLSDMNKLFASLQNQAFNGTL